MQAVTPADADGTSRLHLLRLAAIVTLLIHLSGCASIPKDMARQVNSRGAHATFVRRVGPVVQLETVSVLPGNKASNTPSRLAQSCVRDGIGVEVRALAGLAVEEDTCQRIAESAAWAKRAVGGEQIEISYVITFVPVGTSRQKRHNSLSLGRSATAGFSFAWFEGQGVASRRAAITVAHETSHIVAGLLNDAARQLDERRAYWIGACASAIALKELSMDDFSRGAIVGSSMPEEVTISAEAGWVVAGEISRLFDRGEERASAATLSKVSATCSSKIGGSGGGT